MENRDTKVSDLLHGAGLHAQDAVPLLGPKGELRAGRNDELLKRQG